MTARRQPRPIHVTVRRGRHVLHAAAVHNGADLVVVLGGGERPHVGCVALAVPHPSTADPERTSATASVLAIPPHREGQAAASLAAALARALGVVVVVAAGIHTDGLDADGIATFEALVGRVQTMLLRRLHLQASRSFK